MGKVDFCLLLCALVLCFQIKSTEQSQCNVRVSVYDGNDPPTKIPIKYNVDGAIEIEAGQEIKFRIRSKSVPYFTFSPNLEVSSTQRFVGYKDIFDSTTYTGYFGLLVKVGANQSGWFDCDDDWQAGYNSTTIFFTSDTSGKKFAESGSTIQMKETFERSLVPCWATNKNVSPTLRIISPADLKNDNVLATYYPTEGFWLHWDDKMDLAKTFECAVDEEKVIVEVPETDFDYYDGPVIWMNKSSNLPECSVKTPSRMVVKTVPCLDPLECRQRNPPFYQPVLHPDLKVSECASCTDISVPMVEGPTGKPFQTMTISGHAHGRSALRDFTRGLDGVYYFGDRIHKTPEVTIQAKEISRTGSKITVGVKALGYLYFPVRDASILFRNGSTQFLRRSQMKIYFDDGIHNVEVTVDLKEDMEKITFHAFSLNSMKMTNVSVDLASADYLLGEKISGRH